MFGTKAYLFLIGLFSLGMLACQTADTVEVLDEAEAVPELSEITNQLNADAGSDLIASHLLAAEHQALPTSALAMHFAGMNRDTAYGIQLMALGEEVSHGGRLIGWKMGGTRVTDSATPPDPSFAYMLYADSLANGDRIYPDAYVGDSVLVEAEIAFIMGKDLEGPVTSEAQLIDAIASVTGAIELISIRLQSAPDGTAPSMEHMIAARLSHAGVILGEERLPVSALNLAEETAVVEIDGVEQASGGAHQIMNSTPLDALMWIANALPEHGIALRAGDVVITGGLYDNPTLKPGQTAVVRFTSLGDLSVSMAE